MDICYKIHITVDNIKKHIKIAWVVDVYSKIYNRTSVYNV